MSVELNEAGLNFLFRSETGPVAVHMEKLGEAVERRAADHATGRPGPNRRSYDLWLGIDSGLVRDEDTGSFAAIIGTDARSPRQNFPYPLALEIGMPAAFPLPRGQRPYGPYPFLRPALADEFAQVG